QKCCQQEHCHAPPGRHRSATRSSIETLQTSCAYGSIPAYASLEAATASPSSATKASPETCPPDAAKKSAASEYLASTRDHCEASSSDSASSSSLPAPSATSWSRSPSCETLASMSCVLACSFSSTRPPRTPHVSFATAGRT